MNTSCPVCGSVSIKTTKTKHMIPIVYSNPAIYDEVLETCEVCGESGDFSEVNDEQIDKAILAAKKQSVIDMLDDLSDKSIKMSYMERALELPTRTIARWKGGDLSSSSLALLRIIRTYPWILEVADAQFDESIASSRLVQEAAHVLEYVVISHTRQAYMDIVSNNKDEIEIRATLKLKDDSAFDLNSMKPRLVRNNELVTGGTE